MSTEWDGARIAELRREMTDDNEWRETLLAHEVLSLLDELESTRTKLQYATEETRSCSWELESVRRERDELKAANDAEATRLLDTIQEQREKIISLGRELRAWNELPATEA